MITQGSIEWLNLRKTAIGSSDIAGILNCSKWSNPQKVWEDKVGLSPLKTEMNWAMRRGVELEPRIRAHLELLMDCEYPPALIQHQDHEWIRSSLDGINHETRTIIEIKANGKVNHDLALQGELPKYYLYQCFWHLAASGYDKVIYYSWYKDQGAAVIVFPDEALMKPMFEKASTFWFDHVIPQKPPPANF